MQGLDGWWRGLGGDAEPRSPVLVVVLHDDPQAVSRLPADHSTIWAQATRDGRTATARVADRLGVTVVMDQHPEIPAGHDLVLVAAAGRGLTTAAAELACNHLGAEPQRAVGYGSGISDNEWMDKVVDVRERCAQVETEDVPAPIKTTAAVLDQAAELGLPVLLDGAVATAAATVCTNLPEAGLPTVGEEPAVKTFLDRLSVPVWGAGVLPPGHGLGALGGLSALQLALLAADV